MKLRTWMKSIESKYGVVVDMERKVREIESEHGEIYDLDEEVGFALGTTDLSVSLLRTIVGQFEDEQGADDGRKND